jgi:Flp pilus assembly protein TadG
MKRMRGKTGKLDFARKLRGDKDGAVLAEFAIAILPLLMAFFVFFQVGVMITAKMIVRHATIAAARAGIVIKGGGDTNPMMGGAQQGTDSDITAAFQTGLGVWGQNGMLAGTVDVSDPGTDYSGPVTATATVNFTCRVPMGARVVCPGGTLVMTDTATLPKQGAHYK